jgi:PQQ-like domain
MPGKQNRESSALQPNCTYSAITPAAAQPTSKPRFHTGPTRSRLAVAILCPLLLLLNGCAYYMYRGGASRSARSGADTSTNAGIRQWSYPVGLGQNRFPYGPLVGFTSIPGGIFVGDLFGNISSISTNGLSAWTYPTGGIGATPNAVGIDGSVYALNSATLYAVSSSGVLEWTFSPPQGLSPANLAIARDGTIYTGDQCGFGNYARNCNFYTPTISPAVSEDGTIYSGVIYGSAPPSGVMFALNSAGGLIWNETNYVGTPAIASYGILYVLSLDQTQLYALNTSGSLLWQVTDTMIPDQFTLPAISPLGTVYVGTAFAGLWAIDSMGNVLWKTTLDGNSNFFAPPSIGGDGTIYIAYTSLYAVNPGPPPSVKWSTPLCGGEADVYAGRDEPVIGLDGTIYMILDGVSANVPPCPLEAFH